MEKKREENVYDALKNEILSLVPPNPFFVSCQNVNIDVYGVIWCFLKFSMVPKS